MNTLAGFLFALLWVALVLWFLISLIRKVIRALKFLFRHWQYSLAGLLLLSGLAYYWTI
jgi:hypothetical protein